MSIEGLNRLKVWVRAKDFALAVYKRVLPLLPAEEKWNLNQQLRRASVSIVANTAEGYDGYISYLKKSKQGANEPGANYSIHEHPDLYATLSAENTIDTQDTTF